MEGVGPVLVPLWSVICTDPNKPWGKELTLSVNNRKKIEVYHEGRFESLPILSDNYLVVTKLPNFLSLDFADILKKEGDVSTLPSMLVFDGMNGIGTRAVELLTQPEGLKQLERIKNEVSQLPAFQLLFRVSDFELTGEGDKAFHKANTIELIDDPVPIDPDPAIYQKAHEYAMPRLKMEGSVFPTKARRPMS
jgi:hypothetical protein